jgi:hypothetical protein
MGQTRLKNTMGVRMFLKRALKLIFQRPASFIQRRRFRANTLDRTGIGARLDQTRGGWVLRIGRRRILGTRIEARIEKRCAYKKRTDDVPKPRHPILCEFRL